MSKKLDINRLKEKLGEPISSKEALKNVVSIDWSKDVLDGKKKVIVSKADE